MSDVDHVTDLALPGPGVDLDDAGAVGWQLAWCIGPNGDPWPWLIDPTADHGHGRHASQPHELGGPLPAYWRDRIAPASLPRCGRPRRDGHPCRSLVSENGRACRHHRDTATP